MPSITEITDADSAAAVDSLDSTSLIAALDSLTLRSNNASPMGTLLQAFLPTSAPLAVHKAHLSLATLCGVARAAGAEATPPTTPGAAAALDASQLAEALSTALQSSNEARRIAALRLLGAMAALGPETHVIPLLPSLLPLLLRDSQRPAAQVDVSHQLTAQLLALLAGTAAARGELLQGSVRDWCDTLLEAAEIGVPKPDELLARAALAAGLARLKVGVKQPVGSTATEGSTPATKEQQQHQEQEEKDAQLSLFALARAQVIAAVEQPQQISSASSDTSDEGQRFFAADCAHAAQLNALESLAHLAVGHKERLSNDVALLVALCSPALLGVAVSSGTRKSVFPARDAAAAKGSAASSSYDADPTAPRARADGAASYALASILATLVAPPAALSAQERQMLALRHKASGTTPAPKEPSAAVEARARRVLEAGATAAVVRVVAASTAKATRTACAVALLGLATPQERTLRARLVREGGAKASLALASAELAQLEGVDEATEEAKLSLQPLQALAKLCVSLNPAAMFAVPAAPLRVLGVLFLCPASNALQRFEAALALTNLASLPGMAGAVASVKWQGTTVEEALRERIAASIRMERRASVELLCNLVADEQVHARWAGEEEDEATPAAAAATKGKSAALGRLHVLIALCAPALEEEEEAEQGSSNVKTTETTLATRLAASGALAGLLSSAAACSRLLQLAPRTLNILARCIVPGTKVRVAAQTERFVELTAEGLPLGEEEDSTQIDEEAEARAEQRDAASSPDGDVQSARNALALRAVSVAACLAQYVGWLATTAQADARVDAVKKLQQSGLVDATLEIARRKATGQAEMGISSIAREAVDSFLEAGVK